MDARRSNLLFIGGLGAGAGLMLFLDPVQGSRRRARLRDAVVHSARVAGRGLGTARRDLALRGRGVAARLRRLTSRRDVPDYVLRERVRSVLGRHVSHPRSIDVAVRERRVSLSGTILASERDALLEAVESVRGVREVFDRLDVRAHPGTTPELRYDATAPAARRANRRWTPATRLALTSSATALAIYGLARRDGVGLGLAVVGAGLFARGATNLNASRLTGVGAGRRAVEVQKTIDIDVPVERVFEIWRRPDWMPRVARHVREVRPSHIQGHTHWVIDGIARLPIQFEAVVTAFSPNELIGWKTERSGIIQHAGIIRFERLSDSETRLQIRMSYNPPGGALGHWAARLTGNDLRSRLDEELTRIKTYLESGRFPHDARRPGASVHRFEPSL